MASARVVCASREMEPYDMAPVQKRFTISFCRLDLAHTAPCQFLPHVWPARSSCHQQSDLD